VSAGPAYSSRQGRAPIASPPDAAGRTPPLWITAKSGTGRPAFFQAGLVVCKGKQRPAAGAILTACLPSAGSAWFNRKFPLELPTQLEQAHGSFHGYLPVTLGSSCGILRAIAKRGQLQGRRADSLYVTQRRFSLQIQNLEKQLDVSRCIDRGRQPAPPSGATFC